MSEGVHEIQDEFEDDEPDAMKNTDIDGQLYSNVRAFKPSPRDGIVASVHFQWWKRPSGVAAVCLGLLCVLLSAGIKGLAVYYGVIGHHDSTERDQLQASYSLLTNERDQLQASYNNMTEERNQLQTRVRFYEKPCLSGWWKFGTSCYYVSSTMNTPGAGQKECRTMGGELVVINSREEQMIQQRCFILWDHIRRILSST
ncbi:C-type lectin domain family 7 member A-like [Salmo trutta]|uniref:C-type lectin domain family 7 member A-like n=1 Tax=Salmo trutta TaxID=8032 RepID=UPI001131D606|nr:C-type lectin domain family 7 member A-like [Salmo trutta]